MENEEYKSCGRCAFYNKYHNSCMLARSMSSILDDDSFTAEALKKGGTGCKWFLPREIIKALSESSSIEEFMIYSDLLGCSDEVKNMYWIDWFPNTEKYASYKMLDYMRMIARKRSADKRIAFPPVRVNICSFGKDLLARGDKFLLVSSVSDDFYLVSKYISENAGFIDIKKEPLAKFMM